MHRTECLVAKRLVLEYDPAGASGPMARRPWPANDNQRGGWQSLACLANAVIGRLALPLVAETTIEFMRPGFDESRSFTNVDTTVSEGGRDTGRNSPEERSQRRW